MSARPPVCIFIPTLEAGGAERVASILANYWREHRRTIVITYFKSPDFFLIDGDVEIIRLGFEPNRGSAARSLDIAYAMQKLRRVIRKLNPAFVLSFMNKYNAFCLAALKGTGIPVVVSERDSPIEQLPRAREIARDLLYPSAAGVICQTSVGLQFITKKTHVRAATVIPNPVIQIISPSDRVPRLEVLGVGRFVPKKGFDLLLRAFAKMHDQNWRLVLCGDGPSRAHLERLAIELNVGDRVDFPGLISDLGPFYKTAGIFAFPSLFEGFPNALAEALVSGIPCISFDCQTGPADLIVNESNGLLLPVGDVSAMTQALDRLANEPNFARQLSTKATELEEALRPSRIANDYLAFCDAVSLRFLSA